MKTNPLTLLVLSFFVLLSASAAASTNVSRVDGERLRQNVAALGLSFSGYTLADQLTEQQIAYGVSHRSSDSFPGTYTIVDGELNVVVDEKTEIVLAVYQKYDDAEQERLKQLVGNMMGAFGEPTSIAHEKIIYWLYNVDGQMSQEQFDKAKDAAGGVIDILASVKLSSSRPIEEAGKNTDLYWILSSNRMLRSFMTANNDGTQGEGKL